jgi:hypothetical protein
MRKVELFKLGETEFRIRQLGGIEGRALLPDLFRIGAPLIQGLAAEANADESKAAEIESKAVGYVFAAMTHVDAAVMNKFCAAFQGVTEVKAVNAWLPFTDSLFDETFAGDYGGLLKWLIQNLKLNFSNFLGVRKPTGLPGDPPAAP